MRHSQSERMEIIQLVENSELSIRKTLAELEVPRSTFYDWYRRYQKDGYDGLADQKTGPRQFWNQIPESVQEQVVELALAHPEKSSRQLAWQFTDDQEYFVSESSVYRILKSFDLVQSPAFLMVTAQDKFENPTTKVNELWQTCAFMRLSLISRSLIGVGTICLPFWMTTPGISWLGNCLPQWLPQMLKIL